MAFGDYAALLSSFTGPDENPLSEGGNWSPVGGLAGVLERVGDAVTNTLVNPHINEEETFWTPQKFGPDCEVYVTVKTTSGSISGGNDNQADLCVRVQSDHDQLYRLTVGGFTSGSASAWQIQKSVGGTAVVIASATQTVNSGDKIGMRIRCFTIDLWINQGSGWNEVLSYTDTDATYIGSGLVGFGCSQSSTVIDDIYAGTIPRDAPCPGDRTGVWILPRTAPMSQRA
jgi:hypothetical protein